MSPEVSTGEVRAPVPLDCDDEESVRLFLSMRVKQLPDGRAVEFEPSR